MISKQRGIIDPWSLGFLIGLTGLAIAQPWDREDNKIANALAGETQSVITNKNKPAQQSKQAKEL